MSKLEKMLEHLIADNEAEAAAVFHEFIVEKAKRIHREIISEAEGDDDLEMSLTDDDLSDGDTDMADGEATDDLSQELTDMEGGEEGEEADLADRVEQVEDDQAELEDKLEELTAQFRELVAKEEEEHEDDESVKEGEEVILDFDAELDEDKDEDFSDGDFDDFADLEESLKPVSFDGKANRLAGAGGSISPDTKSPVGSRKSEARAIQVKGDVAKGYEREKAPAVRRGPKTENSQDSATLTPVPREGNKSAKLNSREGFGTDNGPSPISGKK